MVTRNPVLPEAPADFVDKGLRPADENVRVRPNPVLNDSAGGQEAIATADDDVDLHLRERRGGRLKIG